MKIIHPLCFDISFSWNDGRTLTIQTHLKVNCRKFVGCVTAIFTTLIHNKKKTQQYLAARSSIMYS